MRNIDVREIVEMIRFKRDIYKTNVNTLSRLTIINIVNVPVSKIYFLRDKVGWENNLLYDPDLFLHEEFYIAYICTVVITRNVR